MENISSIKVLASGVLMCAIVAFIAKTISIYFGIPVMLLCLFLGMAFHIPAQKSLMNAGVDFTSRSILRIGVVLIGARIMFSDFISLGGGVVTLVVVATGLIILLSMVLARILKLEKEQGLLIGGAIAICGASAALALSAIMPASKNLEKNTLIAVVGVTLMGTASMVLYPFVLGFLGIVDQDAGILIGGTIHDVSQVVGAGYSISQETGDIAVMVKLIRVFLLVPILFLFALYFRSQTKHEASKASVFPLFLVGFIIFVILNSLHIIPTEVAGFLKDTSKWLLAMAITAVGMKTPVKALFSLGWRPVVLIISETAFLFILYFSVIVWGVL